MKKSAAQKRKKTVTSLPQDFASVAARLECDPDLDKFDAKLAKIAKIPKGKLRNPK
jgi:hypothetical protein